MKKYRVIFKKCRQFPDRFAFSFPDYFITIQFLATLAVLFELISFILLAFYYLAPSQSKAAKTKSIMVLSRSRATLGGDTNGNNMSKR